MCLHGPVASSFQSKFPSPVRKREAFYTAPTYGGQEPMECELIFDVIQALTLDSRRLFAKMRAQSFLGHSNPPASCPHHTIPFRNSSSGYFVPRHVTPSFHSVRNIDRSSVYSNSTVLTGCSRK